MYALYLLITIALIVMVYGLYLVVCGSMALWRGDPRARMLKRRRKYLKDVRNA